MKRSTHASLAGASGWCCAPLTGVIFVMDRSNHYEAAFEGYLRHRQLTYVAIDETRRSMMGDAPVKSADFLVYGPLGSRLIVDVKGRKVGGNSKRRTWQNWTNEEDVEGLERWVDHLGPDHRGLFVFTYALPEDVLLPDSTPDLFTWQEHRYLLRAIDVQDYRKHLRVRSPRWRTVHLPGATFRELIRPVWDFIHEPNLVGQHVPF